MPVTIIAEAGVNHNGSLEMAKEMARVAKECGADIVKYQTAVPELVVSKFAEKAEYQKPMTPENGKILRSALCLQAAFILLSIIPVHGTRTRNTQAGSGGLHVRRADSGSL